MLNLNNTLDGYLKNVEVIGNTIQDETNLADIRSVGDKVEGQELYNISIQVDNGDGVNEVVEILSPVQLEKVGDVADRIICKDGVWGVEKNILSINKNKDISSILQYGGNTNTNVKAWTLNISPQMKVNPRVLLSKFSSVNYGAWESTQPNRASGHPNLNNIYITTSNEIDTIEKVKEYLEVILVESIHPQFIPLPHDQQVKLRTFAGQTNISFLTEIAGQVKAQVPKSLGATVNTHTEQISNLNKELDRVKKLEETTVSTIETEVNFTTVEATSNGYFEDVKLEGKTLVNKLIDTENTVTASHATNISYHELKPGIEYTIIVYVISNNNNKAFYPFRVTYDDNSYVLLNNMPLESYSTGSIITDKFVLEDKAIKRIWANWCSSYVDGDVITTKLLLIEGDHTNRPPSYFEGLLSVGQDVEEVSVESANKNRLHITENYDWKYGTVPKVVNGIIYGGWAIGYKLYLEKGGYVFSCNRQTTDNSTPNALVVKLRDVSTNTTITSLMLGTLGELSGNLTIPHNGEYIIMIDNQANIATSVISNIQLCRTELYTGYTPHKFNKKPLLYYNPTTGTWGKPILREWDTIEKHSDGKYYYHKRSGEVVLNNSATENWSLDTAVTGENTIRFKDITTVVPSNANLIGDRFEQRTGSHGDFEYLLPGTTGLALNILKSRLATQDVAGLKAWLQDNPTTVVYQLAQEEVYECTNIDLMTYSKETNYIVNSGAISPKSLLKVHNNISNVVKILQEKVNLLENTFIAGLRSVLAGDMYSLATILYPEDFEQNDNIENDIMVIPE